MFWVKNAAKLQVISVLLSHLYVTWGSEWSSGLYFCSPCEMQIELIELRAPHSSSAALLSWITVWFHIHIVLEWVGGRQLGRLRGSEGKDVWRRRTAVRYCSTETDERRERETVKPSCRLAHVRCILHASDITGINTCSILLKRNKASTFSKDVEYRNYTLVSSCEGSVWD